MSRFLMVAGRKINLDTCGDCKGSGHTAATAPEMVREKKGKLRTVAQGSGCPKCRGRGVTA